MKIVTAVIIGCLFSIHAWAADSPPSAERMKAATELLHLLNVEKSTMAGVDIMMNMTIHSHPMMAPYRGVIMQWAKKYLSWPQLGPKLTRLYANAFTRPQLRDLIRFYKSPTGQKAVREMPKLAQQGAIIGEQIARKHIADLQRMIKARTAQLQKVSP